MKKSVLQLFVLASMSLFIACKGEKKDGGNEAGDAAEISEAANSYLVDVAASQIQWVGSKPIGKHSGVIGLKNGAIFLNNGKVEGGKFIIDMTSITVTDLEGEDKTKLENHLLGTGDKEGQDHFFNTTKFPEGTFEITAVNTIDSKTTIKGNLTIKEKTKEVEFPATLTLDGDNLTLTSESFKINRTHWNVNYASKTVFEDLSNNFIDDEIELKVVLSAKK